MADMKKVFDDLIIINLYLVRYKWEVNNISVRHNNNVGWNKLLDGPYKIVKCDIRFPNLPERKF